MTPGPRALNTYRAVSVGTGRWAVEWSRDGTVIGRVFGSFDTEAEALFSVYELARMELSWDRSHHW
jgi:hypothetical protein